MPRRERTTSFDSLPREFGALVLLRLIAQGGMGQVFLALREVGDVEEVCVVKTVRSDLKRDREAVARFLDEARLVQQLRHPGICRTLDVGTVADERGGETWYLALELVAGRNLRDVATRAAAREVPLTQPVVVHVGSQVLAALGYAHGLVDARTRAPLGIVHRDVSPHNIMLGYDGHAKLIDFGLAAHALKSEVTKTGVMIGKLRYNAPEQVRDRAVDGRSDIYSVGVMLYELFTGERFYENLTEEQIWKEAMKGGRRPRAFAALDPDLRELLDVALDPDPGGRFASCEEMRDELLAWADARGLVGAPADAAALMAELYRDEQRIERELVEKAARIAEARSTNRTGSSSGNEDIATEVFQAAPSWMEELAHEDTHLDGAAFDEGQTAVDHDPRLALPSERPSPEARLVRPEMRPAPPPPTTAPPSPGRAVAATVGLGVVAGMALAVWFGAPLWKSAAPAAAARDAGAEAAGGPRTVLVIVEKDPDGEPAPVERAVDVVGAPSSPEAGGGREASLASARRPDRVDDDAERAPREAAADDDAARERADGPRARARTPKRGAGADKAAARHEPAERAAGRAPAERAVVESKVESKVEAKVEAKAEPPRKAPRTTKERIDFLAASCPRAPCAPSLLQTWSRVTELSVQETRAFMDDLQRCVDRCAR